MTPDPYEFKRPPACFVLDRKAHDWIAVIERRPSGEPKILALFPDPAEAAIYVSCLKRAGFTHDQLRVMAAVVRPNPMPAPMPAPKATQ